MKLIVIRRKKPNKHCISYRKGHKISRRTNGFIHVSAASVCDVCGVFASMSTSLGRPTVLRPPGLVTLEMVLDQLLRRLAELGSIAVRRAGRERIDRQHEDRAELFAFLHVC